MSVDQLIAKALSTTSEDEAIACLRMARKKNVKATESSTPHQTSSYNGYSAEYWYKKAEFFYHEYRHSAKKNAGYIEAEQIARLDLMKARREIKKLKNGREIQIIITRVCAFGFVMALIGLIVT